jgi:flagellar FliJ protein
VAKRFRFRLETVLRVRKLREREARRKLAVEYEKVARLDALITQTREEIENQMSALRLAQQTATLDPAAIVRGHAWSHHLQRMLLQQQELRSKAQQKVEQALGVLREARRASRAIEKLREKQWETYVAERDKQDQAEIEELAQQLQAARVPELSQSRTAHL